MTTDVVIIGKGIAGLVLSFLLKKVGFDHIILERKSKVKPYALGETIPPSALPLLQSLGLREIFEKTSIRKTYGYHSAWGSDRLNDQNFYFQKPYKYGLKLDKAKLLENLENEIHPKVIHYHNDFSLSRLESGWQIDFANGHEAPSINAHLIVDATGRSRVVIKKLSIPIIEYDDNVAFCCTLPRKKHPKVKHDVLVESFKDGWGLVSGLGPEQIMLSIYTHDHSPIFKQVKDYVQWSEILKDTQYLRYFLDDGHHHKVKGLLANTSKPEQVAGDDWLAIGDAAMAYDPISSHGVSNALYTARQASLSIIGKANEYKIVSSSSKHHNAIASMNPVNSDRTIIHEEDPTLAASSFSHYSESLDEIFHAYLKSRDNLYSKKQ